MKQLFGKVPSNGAFRRIGILSTLWIFAPKGREEAVKEKGGNEKK
jgi:hypothetical protein